MPRSLPGATGISRHWDEMETWISGISEGAWCHWSQQTLEVHKRPGFVGGVRNLVQTLLSGVTVAGRHGKAELLQK